MISVVKIQDNGNITSAKGPVAVRDIIIRVLETFQNGLSEYQFLDVQKMPIPDGKGTNAIVVADNSDYLFSMHYIPIKREGTAEDFLDQTSEEFKISGTIVTDDLVAKVQSFYN